MYPPPRRVALFAALAAPASLASAQLTLVEAPPTTIPAGTTFDDADYNIVIREGAEIGGQFTVGDRDNPELRPFNQISISGSTISSVVVYNAESFSLSGAAVISGPLYLFGAQTFSVSGGTIGQDSRFRDIEAGNVSGGVFGALGEWENCNLDIAGGQFVAARMADSTINIDGDAEFRNMNFERSTMHARGGIFENCGMFGTVNIDAGLFERLLSTGGSVTINGGQFEGTIFFVNDAEATIDGGTHKGTIGALPDSHLTIRGTDFTVDAQPLNFEGSTIIADRGVVLRARLANGNVIRYDLDPVLADDGGTGIYEDYCDPDATLKLTRVAPDPDICFADWNNSTTVDFFDITTFLADYAAADPRADLVFDAQFNFFDVAEFINIFNAGCP